MAYAPGVGTGFVSIGDYLDANRGTLAREHSDVAQDLGAQAAGAQGAADNVIAADRANYNPDPTALPGYMDAKNAINAYQDQSRALGSHGGVADYFGRHFGDTRQQAGFDANLFGTQAAPHDLSRYLDSGLAAVQPPAAAPASAPAQTGIPDPEQAPYDQQRTPHDQGGPPTGPAHTPVYGDTYGAPPRRRQPGSGDY